MKHVIEPNQPISRLNIKNVLIFNREGCPSLRTSACFGKLQEDSCFFWTVDLRTLMVRIFVAEKKNTNDSEPCLILSRNLSHTCKY